MAGALQKDPRSASSQDKLTPVALVSPGRASLHDKASLRIEQIRSEDQGWYECKVLMLDQQYDTFHNGSWVHLTVNGKCFAGRGWLPTCR